MRILRATVALLEPPAEKQGEIFSNSSKHLTIVVSTSSFQQKKFVYKHPAPSFDSQLWQPKTPQLEMILSLEGKSYNQDLKNSLLIYINTQTL